MKDLTEKPWKVLVVDDNHDFCNIARIALEMRGIPVCTANNAAEAGQELVECAVGMIVMDYHLGTAVGVSVVADVRRADPYLPILFVSNDQEALNTLKADEWLFKSDKEFGAKLVLKVRDEMDRYTSRRETRDVGRAFRQMLPRVEALEKAHVVTGEMVKAHAIYVAGQKAANGRLALVKRVLTTLIGLVGPLLGGVWYLTKDIARDQIREIPNIAPMRAELARVVRGFDSLVADRELERRERLQAAAEQRTINAKQEAIQSTLLFIRDRLPERPAPVGR